MQRLHESNIVKTPLITVLITPRPSLSRTHHHLWTTCAAKVLCYILYKMYALYYSLDPKETKMIHKTCTPHYIT